MSGSRGVLFIVPKSMLRLWRCLTTSETDEQTIVHCEVNFMFNKVQRYANDECILYTKDCQMQGISWILLAKMTNIYKIKQQFLINGFFVVVIHHLQII